MAFDRKEYMELGARVGAPTLVDGGRRVLGTWEDDLALLAPFGVGADFLTEGRKILGDLQVRREAQGKSLASMPERAAELQLVKGQAYALVKQLSRAARVALPTEQARAYTPTRLFTSPARKPKATDGAAG